MSVLETERLVLRPIREGDADDLFALWSDPEVMRFIGDGKPRTREDTEVRLRRALLHWREHGFGLWALLDKAGGFVGGCGVGYFHELPDAELGYALARSHWGRGLASEAVAVVLRHAFEVLDLPRVVGVAQAGNDASQSVLLKAGMALRQAYQYEGKEALMYAIENPLVGPARAGQLPVR
jgi:RimJ/RimL family protein N-acetyltransferase